MYPSGSLMRRLLAMAATALAVAAVLAPTGSATGHRAARPAATSGAPQSSGTLPYQDPRCRSGSASPTCWPDDARGEDRPDDPGRAGRHRRRHRPRSPPTTSAACCPAAARCRRRTRPTAWADMVDRYQAGRARRPGSHIPLIYGIDTVHGDGNMYGATVFPHNIGLGATRDPALVARGRARRRRPRPGRPDRSGRSRRASASRATTAGAAPTSRSARTRRWWRRWRPRSTASRARPGTSPTTTACSPPPSTSPATASRRTAPAPTTQTTGNYPIDQGVDQVDHAHVRPARARAVRRRRCSSTTSAP